MATLTLNYSNDDGQRIQAAITKIYNYKDNKIEAETQAQFTKRMLIKLIKDTVHQYEKNAAHAAAEEALTNVDLT